MFSVFARKSLSRDLILSVSVWDRQVVPGSFRWPLLDFCLPLFLSYFNFIIIIIPQKDKEVTKVNTSTEPNLKYKN